MTIPEIGKLEPVGLRTIWTREDWDFTPWLAQNLDQLGAVLDMELELIRPEVTLPSGAGRVDILAKVQLGEDEETETVVIENQLEHSNSDHLARLLGYAANQNARILVWVTSGFLQYHRRILEWLNEEGGIHIYGVQVSGWRIGEAKAPRFDVVVFPRLGEQSASSRPTAPNKFSDFFRPLTDGLRGEGVRAIGGRQGGWVGSNRTFRTGYEDQGIVYVLNLGYVGMAWAGLVVFRRESANREAILTALREIQVQISDDITLSNAQPWHDEGYFLIGVSTEASFEDPAEKLEATRDWMFENLIKLKSIIQPRLDQIMADLQPTATTEDDGPSATHDETETAE